MKNTAKLKCHLTLTLFFFISFGACNAQEFFNYNNVGSNTPSQLINKGKIDAILNSDSVSFTTNSSASRTTSAAQVNASVNTLEINYSNLNEVNGMQNQNIKNCIVKITAPVSTINLNVLNHFSKLEVVHVIIETPLITGNIRDLIVMTNSLVLISYQISILQ
ncbi:hypothetical protein ACFSX9_03235 [Flavobacterium ardleyense]|uniref:Lipoprotein n=1 Tax=Flavobacterium ardleyense TaxID=2038737 RepID=A0ABW5Z5Z3_9FLAO